jgi:hypothetical protein
MQATAALSLGAGATGGCVRSLDSFGVASARLQRCERRRGKAVPHSLRGHSALANAANASKYRYGPFDLPSPFENRGRESVSIVAGSDMHPSRHAAVARFPIGR